MHRLRLVFLTTSARRIQYARARVPANPFNPFVPLETLSRRSVGLKPASSPTHPPPPHPVPRCILYPPPSTPARPSPSSCRVRDIHASAMGAGTALTALMHSANIASAVASGSLFALGILSRAHTRARAVCACAHARARRRNFE
jgi:hypothetical protein